MKSQRKLRNECLAIMINYESNQMFVGCGSSILIVGLFSKQKSTKIIKKLNGHKSTIKFLLFIAKNNQLLSCDEEGIILIWQLSQHQDWIMYQKLIRTQERIQSLIINKKENQLISGSSEGVLKFWNEKIDWECDQYMITTLESILNICLNPQNSKLIALASKKIVVLELKINVWVNVQIIKFDDIFGRLAFFDNQQFALFTLFDSIQFFQFDQINMKFVEKKRIYCNNAQPLSQCFQNSKQNSQKIMASDGRLKQLMIMNEEEMILQQNIKCEWVMLEGIISRNEKFLVLILNNDWNILQSKPILIQIIYII